MSNGREFDIVVYRDSSLTGQLVADGADSGGALNELVVGFQMRSMVCIPRRSKLRAMILAVARRRPIREFCSGDPSTLLR